MSSAWAPRARSHHLTSTLPRPRLTLVSKPVPRAARLPFLLFVMVVLVSGLIGLLLLNTALQRGAYTATELRQTSAALEMERQVLDRKVGELQDPQRVALQALQLGMVQNDSPAFLSLASESVIGKPTAARATNSVIVDPAVGSAGGGGSVTGKVPGPVAGTMNSLVALPVVVPEPPHPKKAAPADPDRDPDKGKHHG